MVRGLAVPMPDGDIAGHNVYGASVECSEDGCGGVDSPSSGATGSGDTAGPSWRVQ